jgi:hypothetical protein
VHVIGPGELLALITQSSFINRSTLPTCVIENGNYCTTEILRAAGVKFLLTEEEHGLLQCVELPKGWTKQPTEDSRLSSLVDDKGRERASIFYKARREANMRLTTRFNVKRVYAHGTVVATVTDGEEVIHATEPVRKPEECRAAVAVLDNVVATAATWLDERYPDWRNPGAYWD